MHGEFANGLFPGLPWFLDDQRPQGFLGRAFARRVAADIDASPDLQRWQADDVFLALLRHGDDQPGDLVLGEVALQRALQRISQPTRPLDSVVNAAERATRYPVLADDALRGEDVGSLAGGEQPKFAITLLDSPQCRPVIVKFSERTHTPAGRRWADLLICEHLAGVALRESGLASADSEIFDAGQRVYLESTRFDRTPGLGRIGFTSLAALDAAYYGHARIEWWKFASQLARDGWISSEDATELSLRGLFGMLIANSDMHLGNVGLHLTARRPLGLTPSYDMLPMLFRPASTGEVVDREFLVPLPIPENRDLWLQASVMAERFWQTVACDARVSATFQSIAEGAAAEIARARTRAGG